jgi:predicted O-methyltransferase YrrM
VSVRQRLGQRLERTFGKERTDRMRLMEGRYRRGLATRRWIPSDPVVPQHDATMERHDLLRALHRLLSPRTYLEIGVQQGSSLSLSRTKTIGVDPDFAVQEPLRCDLHLVKATSDEFFSRPDALAHFRGVPLDLAFIDGMHLSEFALRDFINVERYLAPTGVIVFDDVLPRNALESARVRRTRVWAGDVYKAIDVVARHRPDLVVLLVNTKPTGTAVVVGSDNLSRVLAATHEAERAYLEAEDPQAPPHEFLSRAAAVDPVELLASEAWQLLVSARESADLALLVRAQELLRSIPKLG